MDNTVTLNREQLHQLIGFIRKRGFKEPEVIVEILDHFACKVEEKLALYPAMSLDDAMTAAHKDFGVAGFNPVVKAMQQELEKKYKVLYRKEIKNVLKDPASILLLVASCLLYYTAYVWCEMNGYSHIFDINDAGLLTYILIVLVVPLTAFWRYRRKGSPVMAAVMARGKWALILFGSISLQPHFEKLRRVEPSAVIGTVAVCWAVLSALTLKRVLPVGYDDSEIIRNYLEKVEA